MNPETSGAVRHIVSAIGAMMAAVGWIAPDQVEMFVGNVMSVITPFVGLVVFAVPVYLSIRAKRATATEAKKIAERVNSSDVAKLTSLSAK